MGHLVLPGTAGNNCSLANTTALDIGASENFDFRVRASADDWTPGGSTRFFSDRLQVPTRGFWFNLANTGRLEVVFADGATETLVSSVATGFSDGFVGWTRWACVADVVTYFTSTNTTNDPDAVSWTQLGTTDARTTDPTAVANTIRIGRSGHTDANQWAGQLHRMRLDIGGTTELDADFSDLTQAEVDAGSFIEDSPNAFVVTINGSDWSYVFDPARRVMPSPRYGITRMARR